jgi:Bacterial Ig-like domain (group 3)
MMWTAMLAVAIWLCSSATAFAKVDPLLTIVTDPATSSAYADTLTFYANAQPPTGSSLTLPTGTLAIIGIDQGGASHDLCSMTIDARQGYQFCKHPTGAQSYLDAGTYRISVVYSGDANYNNFAASEIYTITKATQSFTIKPLPTLFVGQLVDYQFTTSIPQGAVLAGTVAIGNTNVAPCTLSLYNSGLFLCESPNKMPYAGTYPISFSYSGDQNHVPVDLPNVAQLAISTAPTTLTITPNPTKITLGQSTTVKVRVASNVDPDASIVGTISVSDGQIYCTINAASAVNTCTLTPTSAGTKKLSASYGGYADHFNPSLATADLTVNAAAINGVCGSDNGTALISTPTNLCNAGIPSAVTGSGPWSWTCNGSDGGTTASCSAQLKTWTVTGTVRGAGGTISPATQPVNDNASATLTVTPAVAYAIATVSGCGGNLRGNLYTTAAVSANCTVTATFSANPVDGVCGNDNGASLASTPTNLCSVGTPSAVSGNGPWNWTCSGANGGAAANCSALVQTRTTLHAAPNPADIGQTVNAQVMVAPTSGNAAPSGFVVVSDGTVSCNANLSAGSGSCALTFDTPGTHLLHATYPGTSGFAASSASDSLTINEAPSSVVNLNQFGLSGAWYNPATSGQGFVLGVLPDYLGPGQGVLFSGWFTFDVAPAGGVEKSRWYTLQGAVNATDPTATLGIFAPQSAGNFDNPPTLAAKQVGTATMTFSDCTHGSLSYRFSDGSNRSNTIAMTRLDNNVTCARDGDNGHLVPGYLLSGAWYDPNTSGQGLLFGVNPDQHLLFAAWYTFAPNGQATGGAASQRWYTLQLNTYNPNSATQDNIPIYATTGGVFDDPAKTVSVQVGSAKLTFASCSDAMLEYHFSDGANVGLSNTIHLQRLGTAADGCALPH